MITEVEEEIASGVTWEDVWVDVVDDTHVLQINNTVVDLDVIDRDDWNTRFFIYNGWRVRKMCNAPRRHWRVGRRIVGEDGNDEMEPSLIQICSWNKNIRKMQLSPEVIFK